MGFFALNIFDETLFILKEILGLALDVGPDYLNFIKSTEIQVSNNCYAKNAAFNFNTNLCKFRFKITSLF